MFYFVFFDTFYNKETQQQRQTLTTQLVRKHKDTEQHNENSTIRTKRDLVQSEWFFYPLDRVVFLVGTAHSEMSSPLLIQLIRQLVNQLAT